MTGLSKETNGMNQSGDQCTGVQPKHQNCPSTQIRYIIFVQIKVKSHWFFLGPVLKNHGWWFLSPMYPCQRPSMFHAKVALFCFCQSWSRDSRYGKKNLPGSEVHNQPIAVIWSNWTCVHTTSVKYYVNNIHNQSKHKTTNQSELVFLIFIRYICIVCSSLKLVAIIETLHWFCVGGAP